METQLRGTSKGLLGFESSSFLSQVLGSKPTKSEKNECHLAENVLNRDSSGNT